VRRYRDYECSYSRWAFRSIERVEQELSGRVRFAFRRFPLMEIHPHALADEDLRTYAGQIGLDLGRFEQDRKGDDVSARIARDVASGEATRVVRGTPTLFFDGVLYEGAYDPATLLEAIAR
jgi:protein-disulfide isomerase